MPDEIHGAQPHDPARRNKQRWRIGFINYVKRKLDERGAKHAKESATETAERRTANATWFIGIFTVVTACVGALQWCAIRSQLDEMQAERRPWISIDPAGPVKIVQPLDFMSDKSAIITIGYRIRNTGKDPALRVRTQTKIVSIGVSGSMEDQINPQRDAFCREMGHEETETFSTSVFPGDSVPQENVASMSSREIKANIAAGQLGFPNTVMLGLVICIDYELPARIHHQTGYSFFLDTINQQGRPFMPIPANGVPQNVAGVYIGQFAN